MPVRVVKRRGKYRLVEPSGRIAKSKNGKARDGGGHKSAKKAHTQKGFINGTYNP
jgi:hypothetical protein